MNLNISSLDYKPSLPCTIITISIVILKRFRIIENSLNLSV